MLMKTFTYHPIQEKKNFCVVQAQFEPVHAFGSAWETQSLRENTNEMGGGAQITL